ncbi:hypothetical protein BBF96_14620 [Anoxybacter fermentans]|uniref:HTH cro/C1-type domain-containing protein n=1 Tax=Anoxybacter fermentans TaxID=1323375 RepID=A0A3Q9HSC1_9FIRM|nr:helix-turn-helix transcriptional regulator [Anoxybacter fermentans]AZR74511.1 hypothetical protein BBF96_14620 [Anoxybacter fermentans]
MKVNLEKLKNFLEERGWNEVIFARKMDLDYSYVYRVMRGQRGVGIKFLTRLIKLCDQNKLNFRDFIYLE